MRKKKIPNDMLIGSEFKTNNFGIIKIVEYNRSNSVLVEFLESGYRTTTKADHIRAGRVKDKLKPIINGVGFIGDGDYGTRGKMIKCYQCWKNMIARCYSAEEQERSPTYKGCSVCVEWHNYQNFAKWYHENLPNDGFQYELDKDIKIEGNKIYSPETCLMVSQEENKIKAKAKVFHFTSPDGKRVRIYNLKEFCRKNNLNRRHMYAVMSGSRKHHRGWTI